MGLAGPRHRAQIRQLLGFRETTVADAMALGQWLEEQVLPQERAYQPVLAAAYQRCRALHLEPHRRNGWSALCGRRRTLMKKSFVRRYWHA